MRGKQSESVLSGQAHTRLLKCQYSTKRRPTSEEANSCDENGLRHLHPHSPGPIIHAATWTSTRSGAPLEIDFDRLTPVSLTLQRQAPSPLRVYLSVTPIYRIVIATDGTISCRSPCQRSVTTLCHSQRKGIFEKVLAAVSLVPAVGRSPSPVVSVVPGRPSQ